MTRIGTSVLRLACLGVVVALSGCGFHLRRSAALPAVMQHRVYLKVSGGGEFARSLAAALRASKVDVVDEPAAGVPTLAVPAAGFATRLLTSTGFEVVGEYAVNFHVQFSLIDASGKVIVPTQTIDMSHQFAIDQTEFSAITSETEAIERSLTREMTDAVMRRLEARAAAGLPVPPAAAHSAG